MRLRARLALATLLVSVPMVLGLMVWDVRSRQQAAEAELIEFTRALMDSPGWLERCAANPAAWRAHPPFGEGARDRGPPPSAAGAPGPPAPARFKPTRHSRPATFASYTAALEPQQPGTPVLAASIRAQIREREAIALTHPWYSATVRVLVRSPGDDHSCAVVLAEGTTEPWLGAILPSSEIWLLPLAAVFAAILLAVGPVIRRIRILRDAVLRSADSEYESGVPIQGSDEIAELGRAFDEAARRVRQQLEETRRSEAALREFLDNTTHDIMIPLSVLQGHLAELQRETARGVASPEVVGSAMNEAHYLGALMHNLAIAAKLDAEQPMLRADLDLGALVERVVNRHRPIANGRNVSLEHATPQSPLLVHADVTLLEQAVGNLVYNAVRYNRAGGHVAVIAERVAADGFTLRVIDDGPGMSDDELARAIERGFRGNAARTRETDGRGLGLNITQRVAELHTYQLTFQRSEYGGLHVELAGRAAD